MILSSEVLQRIGQVVLEAVGTPPDLGVLVTRSLVEANLAGHDSHGVMRLMSYVRLAESGQVRPDARPQIVHQRRAVARVDGRWGWGQPAAQLATQAAIERAMDCGVGTATIRNCNHVGRLGDYVERIAAVGMAGLAMCNAGPAVAPFGGRRRVLGTNPFAFAAPRSRGEAPVLVDFSTAAVAEGKLLLAIANGEKLKSSLLIDKYGKPSADPRAFYEGGALATFGGHKGSGLSVMIELLGGVLSGSESSCSPEYQNGNGTLLVALDISQFMDVDEFAKQTEALCLAIKDSPPLADDGIVLVPGEPEARSRVKRLADGIPLPVQTWSELEHLVGRLGLKMNELVQ